MPHVAPGPAPPRAHVLPPTPRTPLRALAAYQRMRVSLPHMPTGSEHTGTPAESIEHLAPALCAETAGVPQREEPAGHESPPLA